MNKHTKIVISVLFAVIILLSVGITRFYINNISYDTESNGSDIEIIREIDEDDAGNRIFEDASGLYGIADINDRIIVSPEWTELEFAEKNICIASKRIGSRMLTGCIDYEGSIIVPFVYKNIIPCSISKDFDFYIAETDLDSTCVVYNSDFIPFFMRSWDGYTVDDNSITLQSGNNSFVYLRGEKEFVCRNAVLNGNVLNADYTMDVYSQLLLSKLDSCMLEKISETVSYYIDYAFTGNKSSLLKLGSPEKFKTLFPDEKNITSRKLIELPSVFIYSDKDEKGELRFNVSITAKTRIRYMNEEDNLDTIEDSFKALIRFQLSESHITAVSAEFEKAAPDYPSDDVFDDVENAENV